MRPALGGGHRVALVDDDPPRGEKRLACLGAEQEEERLGRGNQDLTGRANLLPPVMRAGVTGADVDARNEKRLAECRRHALHPAERHAQVALDVVDQRFQGRDVDDADSRLVIISERRPGRREAVERVQERRERLPTSGGRDQQRVLASRDALPTPPLHLGGRGEGAGEPVAGGGTEVIQSGLAEFARDGRLLPRVRAT